MFFLDRAEVDRELKRLRRELAASGGISEELRGWSWDKPGPVEPPSYAQGFGVAELAGRYCRTLRDVYLRRVLGLKPPPSVKAARGIALHEVMRRVLVDVKRIVYEGFPVPGSSIAEELLPAAASASSSAVSEAEKALGFKLADGDRGRLLEEAAVLYRFLVVQAAARIDWAMSRFPRAGADSVVSIAVPPVAERKVDGSPVGLSRELSVDLYAGSVILDVKTGDVRSFHHLTAAGYALAIEASEGIPIDYGAIVYVRVDLDRRVPVIKTRFFLVDDESRREFIEARDQAAEIVETGRDPGRPPVCPEYCPWRPVCESGSGGEIEASRQRAWNVRGV